MKEQTIYAEAARRVLRNCGGSYRDARRECIRMRDMNSPGTFSFAEHNATLKALEQIARDEALS